MASNKNNFLSLRSSRANLKGSLTGLASFSEAITEIITREALEVRVEKFVELWVKFNTSQEQMYAFVGVDGYVDPEPEFEGFESKYLVVKSVLLSSIRERNKPETDKLPANRS